MKFKNLDTILKDLRDKIKCPQLGCLIYDEWGCLSLSQRLYLSKLCDKLEMLAQWENDLDEIVSTAYKMGKQFGGNFK